MHRPSPRSVRRVAAAAVAAALAMSACGGGDDDSAATTAVTTTSPTETTPDATEPTAGDIAPTTTPTTAPETTEPATSTTATTATTATTGPSSSAPTTAPDTGPTTVPGTTAPVDLELAQFCFDSEQVYVFDNVTSELQEPTPEQAEAALAVLIFTVDAAVASAPAGLEAQPARAAELLAEIVAVFERYDYDTEALAASSEVDEISSTFDEYEVVLDDLTEFLSEACSSQLDVLDSQARKLSPLIVDLRDWQLQPIADQAGDIRLFVPLDWTEWIGSTELGAATVLEAAPSIDDFESTWNAPGVLISVTRVDPGSADATGLVDEALATSDCTLDTTEPYEDRVYLGELHLFSSCGDIETTAAVLTVTDIDRTVEAMLEFQFPDGTDRELLDRMLASFVAGA